MTEPAPLVLVADDQEIVRKTITTILRSQGFRTAEARDGEEAVSEARRLLPAAILLDLGMPKVDGFEAARRLRADDLTRAIPVIVVSAYDEEEHAERAIEAGADAFLQKPVRMRPLLEAVRRAIREGRR